MIAGDRKSIELVDDVVWIRAEYDATERVAYFDARPPEGRTVHGHSLARWQMASCLSRLPTLPKTELVPCNPEATKSLLDN
jgi:hypothetical protein